MLTLIVLIAVSLCWGSFLNVVGYRLIKNKTLLGRSKCPACDHQLAWYDLIPVISYIILNGNCRYCSARISPLYPMIELATVLSFIAGYYLINDAYHFAFFIFFSALIVTIRSDLEHLLISQWVTIALIPVGILFSVTDLLPIYPLNSILGAAIGYFIPWAIGTLFYLFTKKEGIGQGDFDLLAFVGSFTGVLGVWATLLIGSLLGSIIGGIYLMATGSLQRNVKLPFGPFLAIGALLYSLFSEHIAELLLGY